MLDLTLVDVAYRRESLRVEGLNARFPASSHTALVGSPASGKSAILELFDGSLRADSGRVLFGGRDVTGSRAGTRPAVHSGRTEDPPQRWSVRHVLVGAARTRRGLDFEDRRDEVDRTASEWGLAPLLDRKLRMLSTHERLICRLAQIILLRPAVLLAERLFAGATSGTSDALADRFWRRLRADGVTVLHEISHPAEIGWCDRVALVAGGLVVAAGTPTEVVSRSPSAELAEMVAPSTAIPVRVRGTTVEAPIGSWELASPAFEGPGVAIARPWDFSIAPPGEESDFLFGIEEARFLGPRWELTGLLTGGTILKVWVEPEVRPAKGKLLPMRFRSEALQIFATERSLGDKH